MRMLLGPGTAGRPPDQGEGESAAAMLGAGPERRNHDGARALREGRVTTEARRTRRRGPRGSAGSRGFEETAVAVSRTSGPAGGVPPAIAEWHDDAGETPAL